MPSIKPDYVREDWISSRASSPDAVKRARIGNHSADRSEADPVIAMINEMEEDDELRRFTNSREAWRRRAGRKGYVVLRNGEVVAAVLTALN